MTCAADFPVRRDHARTYLSRRFTRREIGERGVRDKRHLDPEIESVDNGPANTPGLFLCGTNRYTRVFGERIRWIHRGDNHTVCREGHRRSRA